MSLADLPHLLQLLYVTLFSAGVGYLLVRLFREQNDDEPPNKPRR